MMDLNIQDVADLLNVNESTIQKWLHEGVIPGYRIHEDWRFSRDEIEAWMMKRNINEKSGASANFSHEIEENGSQTKKPRWGMRPFSLYRTLSKGCVYKDIAGTSKEAIFRATMQRMASVLDLDADVLSELILDRENLMPTALANGIAIPHARDFLLNKPYDVISVVFPEVPISYGALDGQPVHTLFFLFASEDKSHLHLLAKIAHLSSQPEMVSFLQKRPEKEELLETIRQWESSLVSLQKS